MVQVSTEPVNTGALGAERPYVRWQRIIRRVKSLRRSDEGRCIQRRGNASPASEFTRWRTGCPE